MAKGDLTKTQVWSDIRVDEIGRVFGKRVEVIWEEQADGSKVETHRGNNYRDTIVPFVSTRDSDDEDWVHTDTDVSGKDSRVQAICNAVWTSQVKTDYTAFLVANKPPIA